MTLLCVLAGAARALGQADEGAVVSQELKGIDVEQKLGAQLPLDLRFVDDKGRDVRLADYFDGKRPVLITFNYFKCPMLCGLQLNGLLDALKEMKWTAGDEFVILSVGFDPLEGPKLAEAKKNNYLSVYERSRAASGWHFLTGERDAIKALTGAVGFHYRWVEERQEWAHPSTLLVVSPSGKVCRYFGGIVFDQQGLRLSMVEASEGKVGSLWDQIFLSCFHYVSSKGKYVPFAMGVMRLGGAVTIFLLGLMLTVLTVRENRRRRHALSHGVPPVPPAAAGI